MRLVRNIIIFIVALVAGLAIFMPKLNLYYYLEDKLAQNGVTISNENATSTISSLKLSNANVSYQGADIATIGKLKAMPFIAYNKLEAKNIELAGIAKKFANIEIDNLKATHTLLKPYIVKISANGSFGVANGYANLKQRVLHLDIVDAKDIKALKRFLKRGEKGWYYESKF
jgi:hypothetical protein